MTRTKRLSVGAIIAVVALFGSAMIGGTAQAKKKKKSKTATVTKSVNAPIPDATLGTVDPGPPALTGTVLNGKLATALTVGKKAKGTVGRVAVTFQTTGLALNAARELQVRLVAPDGTTYYLPGGLDGQSVGPLTVQSNGSANICSFDPTGAPPPPPCADPDNTVNPPYVGTVGDSGLNLFNGVKMKGTWSFEVQDTSAAIPPATPVTSILNAVTLKLTPQKPVK